MPSCRLCGWLMANAHTGFIIEHLDGRAERLCCGGVLRNTDEVAGISTIDVLPGVETDTRDACSARDSSFTGRAPSCRPLPRGGEGWA